MSEYSQDENISKEELRARIETLESTVSEVCYTLYELIAHLRGTKPPECPPICARSDEQESS